MVKPFGTLFKDSWAFAQDHMVVLLAGIAVFGVITLLLALQTGAQVAGGMKVMGVDVTRMNELRDKAMHGDQAASQELSAMAEAMNQPGALQERTVSGLAMILPAIGLISIVIALIHLLSASYFLVIAVKGTKDIGMVVKDAVKFVFPVLGLWIWIFLRSFAWIPFVGPFIAIAIGPRFTIAPIYLMENGKGIMESATMSYKVTAGYWGKIFGNMLLLAVIFWAALLILNVIFAIVGLGWFAMIVGTEIFISFGMIFSMQLARSIIANPKMA